MSHSKENNKLIGTTQEKYQIVDLLNKDFKMTVLKIPKELKEDIQKVNKTMCEQNRNCSKEVSNLKGSQKTFLELKSTTEMKNSLKRFKGRFE